MRDLIRNHKKLVALIALLSTFVFSLLAWSATASLRGQSMARLDTARGHTPFWRTAFQAGETPNTPACFRHVTASSSALLLSAVFLTHWSPTRIAITG